MKIPRIANAVGCLDDELVVEAAMCSKKKRSPWPGRAYPCRYFSFLSV